MLALVVARRLADRFQSGGSWRIALALLRFFPLMLSLFTGQMVVLLVICLMQAVSEFERDHELRAGVWMGLLILKPQYAAVFLLVLLVKRRAAALVGFTLGTAALLAGSLVVGGTAGLAAYTWMLISAYPSYAGSTGVDPRGMISWRGFTATALPFLGATSSLLLIAALSLSTLAVLPLVWRGMWDPTHPRFARQLAATVAVTLLVAYHSQTHGAALLLVLGALVVAHAGGTRAVRALLVGIAVGGPTVGLISAIAFGNLWLVGPVTSVMLAAVIIALAHDERAGPGNQRKRSSLQNDPGGADRPRLRASAAITTRLHWEESP